MLIENVLENMKRGVVEWVSLIMNETQEAGEFINVTFYLGRVSKKLSTYVRT